MSSRSRDHCARIVHSLFGRLIRRHQTDRVVYWIVMCLNLIMQLEEQEALLWALSCLLLSASSNDACHDLFHVVLAQARGTVDAFAIACLE